MERSLNFHVVKKEGPREARFCFEKDPLQALIWVVFWGPFRDHDRSPSGALRGSLLSS